MDKQLWRIDEDLFTDIYLYEKDIKTKIEGLINSEECMQLVDKVKTLGNVTPLLDEMVPDKKVRPIPKLLSKLKPFYDQAEYKTKEDYLQYLKQVYGFMLNPLEYPPGRVVSIFFPTYKKNWEPSPDSAEELLRKFYVEVKLINELTPAQWKEVVSATNPEAKLAKLLYGTQFKPDFQKLLKEIPWVISWDVYGAPGLDIVYRRAPGHEMPKKPFGVGESYLNNLVSASLDKQAYTVLVINEENHKLTDKDQITKQIEEEGSARLDSFIGISKVERDFVIHRHIIIWKNPGFEKYQKTKFLNRIIYAKPHQFLCAIKEEALPLEIPFLERKQDGSKK